MGEGNGGETCLSSAVCLACFCSFDTLRGVDGEVRTLVPRPDPRAVPAFRKEAVELDEEDTDSFELEGVIAE